MNRPVKKVSILIVLLIFSAGNCSPDQIAEYMGNMENSEDTNSHSDDQFYSDTGGFDSYRLPVQKPYYFIWANKDDGWFLQSDDSIFSVVNVIEFGIENNTIFGRRGSYDIMGRKRPAGWFIVNLQTEEMVFFEVRAKWERALGVRHIKNKNLQDVSRAWENYAKEN
ncbi:MAG: hypothetical protein OEZ34_04915 [Spirochaetia bacterium]|nr:hypothetical protein [Spirochaetia bacterium]